MPPIFLVLTQRAAAAATKKCQKREPATVMGMTVLILAITATMNFGIFGNIYQLLVLFLACSAALSLPSYEVDNTVYP